MAVRQINTADFDYEMFLETLNKSYKGKADITIDEYDTTAAPDVKVGSVWEDNGAIFILETSDLTPTGYAGISNSTTFYLYYDESASVFIYSETVPTWNHALQGWYNSNDRAFFSMYKDSGGTLYEKKSILIKTHLLQIKVIPIGDWDMSAATGDASINVLHGVDFTKIRTVYVIIRNDAETATLPLGNVADGVTGADMTNAGGIDFIGPTTIGLQRLTGGIFDGITFNATSFNRGWVTITYEE